MKQRKFTKVEAEINTMIWALVHAQAVSLREQYGVQSSAWNHWLPLFGEEFGEACTCVRQQVTQACGAFNQRLILELVGILAMCVESRLRSDSSDTVRTLLKRLRIDTVNTYLRLRVDDPLSEHQQKRWDFAQREARVFIPAMAMAIGECARGSIALAAYAWLTFLLKNARIGLG